MPWLLDTHVWIWSQLEPERPGSETRRILESVEEIVYISTVSTLEMARLVAGGEIELRVSVQWIVASWITR